MEQDMVASGNNCATLLGLVGEFLELQSKRAEAYACLNEGFRDFLASKVEAPFACIMSQVTSTFKDCSEQVNKIEKILNEEYGAHELGRLIRSIQECERTKLHSTIAIQSLRRVYEVEKFGWQTEATDGNMHCQEVADGGFQDVSTRLAFLSLTQGNSCSAGTSRIDGGIAGEPTEVDYHGALGEATQTLQSAIETINDVLEEIRYIQHDLMAATLND